jgi:hypothetical protein
VDSEDERFSEWQLLSVINRGIDTALKNKALAAPVRQNRFKLVPMQKLSEVSFEGKELTDEEYEEEYGYPDKPCSGEVLHGYTKQTQCNPRVLPLSER